MLLAVVLSSFVIRYLSTCILQSRSAMCVCTSDIFIVGIIMSRFCKHGALCQNPGFGFGFFIHGFYSGCESL